MTLAPRSAAYIALLVALGSFGPLTMSIYTPVMPSVGHDMMASAESVKLTLTTYMLGFAFGQLFYGPLSDRYGRRPVQSQSHGRHSWNKTHGCHRCRWMLPESRPGNWPVSKDVHYDLHCQRQRQ